MGRPSMTGTPPKIAKQELQKRIAQFNADETRLLDLSSLGLTDIPALEDLFPSGSPVDVRVLDISHNTIRQLPTWITHFTDLRGILAADNRIQELPDSIGQIGTLEHLDLRDNKLYILPRSLLRLTRLKVLLLHNNLLDLPPELLGNIAIPPGVFLERMVPEPAYYSSPTGHNLEFSNELTHRRSNRYLEIAWERAFGLIARGVVDPTEILSYYFRIREGKRPLNEAKLILVGFGAVGKTSLVNRLVRDSFDKGEKKTEGIQITDWPITLSKKNTVRLHVWDFGGQEIMHATHQFFLTTRSLYLLVISGRQGREDADAEYWLNLTEGLCGQSPVIIVLNKVREHPFTINRNGLLAKFPQIQDFVETDCEEDVGIKELKRVIFRTIKGLKHLRDAFPSAWFDIKNRIAGMEENYLSFDSFRTICDKHGEHDRKAHDELAAYLHSLGIALNYKDDPRLRDTHVLNPHWVTNGIYAILNANVIAERKGEMVLSDLSEILDSGDYPAERHGFLIDLMRKFELCFPFEEAERYLIPELLDKDEPPTAKEMETKATLRFQYHYEGAVPEGLMPRFIVRTHMRSASLPRWRTGVVLRFEGSTALVKAEPSDKRVTVAIHGRGDGPRRLLGIIRDHFDAIHASYRRYAVKEMVPVPENPDLIISYNDLRVMEENGVKSFPKVVGNTVSYLVVEDLLNGVEITPMVFAPALRVFYSYCRKDEEFRDELANHLALLKRNGLILPWHDREITAGEEWKGKIHEALERADIVLLLVSADFLASDYCYDIEMNRAMERHANGEARVIPVILRDCSWATAPFGKLQALPKDGKAVKAWPDRDTAWRNVEEGIAKAIKELQTSGAASP